MAIVDGTRGSQGPARSQEAEAAPQKSGKVLGRAVFLVPSVQALQESIQEEIGQVFSTKRESDVSRERRLSQDGDTAKGLIGRIVEIREAQDAMEKAPDVRARRAQVERMARHVEEQARDGGFEDSEALRDFVLQQWSRVREEGVGAQGGDSPDATELYAVLSHLEKVLGSEQEDLRNLAKDAATRFLSENHREIGKGLAISETAAVYVSEAMGTAPQLRTFYMDQVADHQGIRQSFGDIMKKYGVEGYVVALEFLIRAAGDDMAAMTSTSDKQHQKSIIDNLYELEVLHTVHERTEESLDRLRLRYELSDKATPVYVMEAVFDMVDAPYQAAEDKVTELALAIVVDSIPGRISFLRELRNNIIAVIPLKVFDASDTEAAIAVRVRLITVVTEAQDRADEQEQDMLEANKQ